MSASDLPPPPPEEEHHASSNSDDTSSNLEETSTSSDDPGGSEDAAESSKEYGAGSKAIIWLRLCMLVVLVASAVCVALAIYFYTTQTEHEEFEDAFSADAYKVLHALGGEFDRSLGVVDAFVVGMVSYARNTNMTWPFVTYPDFAVKAAKTRSLSKAALLYQYVLVEGSERARWEEYAVNNDDWVQETLNVQKLDPNYHGTKMSEYSVEGKIYDNYGVSKGEGPFLPIWQSTPVVPIWDPYGWDGAVYSGITTAWSELFEQKKAVLSKVTNIADSNDEASLLEASTVVEWLKDYISPEDDPAEPISEIHYPIVDDAPDSIENHNSSGKVVGLMTLTFFWRDLLEHILPPGSKGVVCVIENACGQQFTYQIDGPDAIYLGEGDLHDPQYDRIGVSATLNALDEYAAETDQVYTGLPLSSDVCPYQLHVYPSVRMADEYLSNNPITFTLSVVLIFVFTSIVFLCYDRCVQMRQRRVMYKALQSEANISMLEKMVKERTQELEESNERLKEANRKLTAASAAQLQHFAQISHEIRTPLNCIIGVSSLLLQTELNPMQEESVRMMTTSGNLLLTVVNDVLDYSRLESGTVDIDKTQRTNLQEVLNAVVHSIETKAQQKKITIRTLYGASLSESINTDGRRLQQILYNLLGNAVKFSDDGGVIELSVSLCSPETGHDGPFYSPSEPLSSTGEKVLRFSVKDYGQGIAEKDLEKIFKPFLQASAETERVYGGSGLGLAITTKLCHGLDGVISVESREGEWSKFSVDFAFHEEPFDLEGTVSELKNTTILLVDTEGETRERIRFVLGNYFGLEMIDCSDLKEAESHICSLSPDRLCVCLIQEDLYDQETYDHLIPKSIKSVLLTFGPNFAVKEAMGHYRSLTGTLPSVLVQSISNYVKMARQQSTSSRTLLPEPLHSVANAAPYTKLRILIAEDNIVNQKVLSRMLSKIGVEMFEVVDNGQKAVERDASEAFDVILMDMSMPVLGGIEACVRIHTRFGPHPTPKVVFVTAHASEAFETRCFEAGGSGFLPKPYNIGDIEKCLQRMYALIY